MPRISASCRRCPEGAHQRGFTLLELLVVLALIALVTGMVAPAVIRGLEAARERGVAADLRALLDSLPVRAFQRGDDVVLDAAALRQLLPDLPADWRLEVTPALRYGSAGVASGGTVHLRAPGREPLAWQVLQVSGAVVPANEGGSRQ